MLTFAASTRSLYLFPPRCRIRNCAWISTLYEAKAVLGLVSENSSISMTELRHVYFTAAKSCHPDTKTFDEEDGHNRFIELTKAYEFVQDTMARHANGRTINEIVDISVHEDTSFRLACQEELGLSAETVEECKRNPGFRQWLMGNTDAAHLWRNFFMLNGGLAPRLRPLPALGKGTSTLRHRRLKRR